MSSVVSEQNGQYHSTLFVARNKQELVIFNLNPKLTHCMEDDGKIAVDKRAIYSILADFLKLAHCVNLTIIKVTLVWKH